MDTKRLALLMILAILGSVGYGSNKGTKHASASVYFRVLYNFTGGEDGCCVYGGLARDRDDNLYGVAYASRNLMAHGLLFKLTPGNPWAFHILQAFNPETGTECHTTPTIDKAGNVFGVCDNGGTGGKGTLWEYSHLAKFIVLHNFSGPEDGQSPEDSVVIDADGNIYGTASTWGPGLSGTLWKYSTSTATFTLLHSFSDGDDGGILSSGPKMDSAGRIWGTTLFGPNCYYCGSGVLWNYDPETGQFSVVLDFDNTQLAGSRSRLAISRRGNLFGVATLQGSGASCGIDYALIKDTNYAPRLVYQFTGIGGDGCDPNRFRFDLDGNIVGTTQEGGDFNRGTVYKLTNEDGAWREQILHSFAGRDGLLPESALVMDRKGNWFGTTAQGGKYNWGAVYELSALP